jgi:hypothetical protein
MARKRARWRDLFPPIRSRIGRVAAPSRARSGAARSTSTLLSAGAPGIPRPPRRTASSARLSAMARSRGRPSVRREAASTRTGSRAITRTMRSRSSSCGYAESTTSTSITSARSC